MSTNQAEIACESRTPESLALALQAASNPGAMLRVLRSIQESCDARIQDVQTQALDTANSLAELADQLANESTLMRRIECAIRSHCAE